jgi:hypothetical protein
VTISAEVGGLLQLKLPFKKFNFMGVQKKYSVKDNILKLNMNKGETVHLKVQMN